MGGHETPSGDPEEDQREEAAIQGSVSNPPTGLATNSIFFCFLFVKNH